jgi:competence protein ComEC
MCDRSLAGLESLVETAQSMPIAYFWTPGPALWWVVGYYLGLGILMIGGRRLIALRWQLGILSLWIVIGFLPLIVRSVSRDELRCVFLDVGHGSCVVMETPDGRTLLYDAGSLGSPDYVSRTIASYLWHRGITSIDAVILSHADVDHYNGVPGLLKRFPIGAVYVSPLMFAGLNPEKTGPVVLQEALDASGVPIHEVWAGDRLRLGDVTIQILHPPELGVLGSDNANSVTALVEYQGSRILLPGDLESSGLELLMSELPMDCDMVLAPHHGSRRSDPPGFAAWSSPEWVVVSGRNSEDTESVVATYRESGARVLHTAVSGAIEFEIGKNGPNVAVSQNR